jgi:hypothetical protein
VRMNKIDLEKLMEESMKLLKRGDTLQASEKLYKIAEECIKILAIQEHPDLGVKDYWPTWLIWKQVDELANIYGSDLRNQWNAAWMLHTKGFHENSLTKDDVMQNVQQISNFIDYLS